MIEMELNKLVIDEKRHEQLIVLKEKKGERLLPIVIGLNEIAAIKSKISGVKPPRPITHDLLFSCIQALGAKLERVLIDKLENNIFFAKLVLSTADGKTVIVDARPSDSIALSVRAHAPIFVEEEVLKQMELFK
ncbi:MAG: bifunctional nuclease family protein [Candidatus Omnitrophica bacterium]|nr:bifunctional nuclease family protein [Candidatus Omnitrophota bacterium]